ncbi:MAG: response regulator [Planctomycetes bacterium]|nr:response regulator [Planctomycetota bacterium]
MADTTQTHLPTIVYVEDSAGDAMLLEEALRESGHAVQLLVIEKGDKALHYFKIKESARDLPPPHCILLDAYLPVVTGGELLRFLRSSRVYDDTPIYIFAPETEYRDVIDAGTVSKESFISKSSTWDGFLQLADLLMASATAKQDDIPASPTDSNPEVHAEGSLRRQDTKVQRAQANEQIQAKTTGTA